MAREHVTQFQQKKEMECLLFYEMRVTGKCLFNVLDSSQVFLLLLRLV